MSTDSKVPIYQWTSTNLKQRAAHVVLGTYEHVEVWLLLRWCFRIHSGPYFPVMNTGSWSKDSDLPPEMWVSPNRASCTDIYPCPLLFRDSFVLSIKTQWSWAVTHNIHAYHLEQNMSKGCEPNTGEWQGTDAIVSIGKRRDRKDWNSASCSSVRPGSKPGGLRPWSQTSHFGVWGEGQGVLDIVSCLHFEAVKSSDSESSRSVFYTSWFSFLHP